MATQRDIDTASREIEALLEGRFEPEGSRMRPVGKDAPGGAGWDDITEGQKFDLLTSRVEWLGFEATEIVEVSRRVVDGESPEFWFDGIAVTDQAERREELFGEMREEEYFRRHGEPPVLGDVERDAEALASFYPDAANDNAFPWRSRLEALTESPNDREPWTEADKLRAVEETWDWTGIEDRQKEALLADEVDFAGITRDEINAIYQAIGSDEVDERPARRLFDEANYAKAVADAKQMEYGEQLDRVRPATRHLIESVAFDSWPRAAAIVDFGIDSQRHYEALYYPICYDEIAPIVLDAAMGNGARLTELVRQAESNPHKDIEFHTSWDVLLGRERPDPPRSESRAPSEYEKAIQQAADMATARNNDRDRGGPER